MKTTGMYCGDGYRLLIEEESISYTSLGHHELKPGWSFSDPAGHVHATLETLEWIVTGTYWCDQCRDEHEDGEWRCLRCGAVVWPEYVWVDESMQRKYLRGLQEVKLILADGRGYLVREDERARLKILADGRVPSEWLEQVSARDPDWLEPFSITIGGTA